MDTVTNEQRFIELEYLLDKYFNENVSPIMGQARDHIRKKQMDEMRDYATSAAGVLSSLATGGMPMSDPYSILKVTGEWNSKNTEDYLAMCKERMLNDKNIIKDLTVLSEQWRSAVIEKVGWERYNEMSNAIGTDLANAFIDYRMEDKMVERLVRENVPKSSIDYIISKAGKSSIFGLSQILNQTALDDEIENRSERAYRPTAIEKGTAYALGAVADTVALGGTGTWTAFAKFVGIDVGISMFADAQHGKSSDKSVEECVSKGIFGTDTNMFCKFQQQSKRLEVRQNEYVKNLNAQLANKLSAVDFSFEEWTNPNSTLFPWMEHTDKKGEYANIPLVIAPDQREQYIEDMAKEKTSNQKKAREAEELAVITEKQDKVEEQSQEQKEKIQGKIAEAERKNENGWGGFLSSVGLENLGDIPKNLGFVLAMLPDVIVGLFTGKTKSLSMDNSMLPLASIVAGLFVRNPLLKTVLIGMGGLNLLNKVSQETLETKRTEGLDNPNIVNPKHRNYRQYPDEELNTRIQHPILQGNSLIASIDNVPYTIQLPLKVVNAYHAGALPLNTLANAVLAKNDQMQKMVSQNYDQEERDTIVRTRGIQ